MASCHCHHRHSCRPTAAATTTNTAYCCYCPSSHPPCHPPPLDPHLVHQPLHFSLYSDPPYTTPSLHHMQHPQQYHPPSTDFRKERYFQELQGHQKGEFSHAHPTVSSLLRRIAALEFSLRPYSSSSSSSSRYHSLRDAAARTIQTHFRAFLVRRSRTLRQLKDLAYIKSALGFLKSSVSDNSRLDPRALSHEALDLLLGLDSIQGDDPMIRDGKKSISRELNRFIDLIDGIIAKRFELSSRLVGKNVKHGENAKKSRVLYSDHKKDNVEYRDLETKKRMEDVVKRIDALYKMGFEEDDEEDEYLETRRISSIRNGGLAKTHDAVQAKAKKRVSFAETGYVYNIPRTRHVPVSTEDCDSDDGSDFDSAKRMLEDDLRREAEEVGGISFKDAEDDEEARSDDGVSARSSDDSERGSSYTAPLPVRMETRTDFMDKRKTAKLDD